MSNIQTANHESWLVLTHPNMRKFSDAVIGAAAANDNPDIIIEISSIAPGVGLAEWRVEASPSGIEFVKTLPFVTSVLPNTRRLKRYTAELNVRPDLVKEAQKKIRIILEEHLMKADVYHFTRNSPKALLSFHATRQAAELISKIGCVKAVWEKG